MRDTNHIRVINHRQLLMRAVRIPHRDRILAQAKMLGEVFQGFDRILRVASVWRLDNQHDIGVNTPDYLGDCRCLIYTFHIVPPRPVLIQQQVVVFIEQILEPLDIVGGDAQLRRPRGCAGFLPKHY